MKTDQAPLDVQSKLTALQALPARQPAVLVMNAGLGWTPGEMAAADALRVVDGQVAETVVFDAKLFGAFGLPEVWSKSASGPVGEACSRAVGWPLNRPAKLPLATTRSL